MAHPFVVVLREPGRRGEYLYHTVARTEREALRRARRAHPRWRHVRTDRERPA